MSTRCLIGIEQNDKTIKYIYCHFDGYIEGVGRVLKENYINIDTIEKLLSLGDISSLGKYPINKGNLYEKAFKVWWSNPTEENKQLMEKALVEHRNYCDAYNEEDSAAKIVKNRKEYMNDQSDAEYRYLFTDGDWKVQKWSSNRFVPFRIKIK